MRASALWLLGVAVEVEHGESAQEAGPKVPLRPWCRRGPRFRAVNSTRKAGRQADA